MGPLLSLTPWGLQEGTSQVSAINNESGGSTISGACCPRLIVATSLYPKYGRKNKALPRVSFPFRWDGKVYSSFQLPTDPKPNSAPHRLPTKISIKDMSHEIIQTDIVGRPSSRHENEFGRSVEGFIDWQIHCFRELSDNSLVLDETEEKAKNIIRRNWRSVRKVWIGNKDDEAIMALIVQLAQDSDLLRLFEVIANHPRHILLRHRQNTSLGRIQELDSACIRDFARRPGRTIYEKAGSRQELLSVQRVESRDTLENRVFSWVLGRMLERSWSYATTNKHHQCSSRVKLVTRCNRRCSEWQAVEGLKEVSTDHLHHPVQPNYTLQMDTRYSRVYKTYKELLREQHVIDDAWEWQRNLWSESARQLMSCAMTEFYTEDFASTPYYRMEGEYGTWTETPVSPGPFETQGGPCFVVDSRDVATDLTGWTENPPFDFAPYIGSVGCDQVLYWPKSKTLVTVWFVYWTGPSAYIPSMINSAGLALRNLSSDLHRYTRISYRCYGLMLITEGRGSSDTPSVGVDIWPSSGDSETVALKIPFNIDLTSSAEFENLIEDFKTGIQLAIDMAC
jgi:hypothetical protein